MRLTASGLERDEICSASASLPRSGTVHADATAGTEEHARLEAETPAGELAEVAYALNVLTGEARSLGKIAHRDYPTLGQEWIFGTADRIRVAADRVVITDHKTGGGGRFNTTPARENLQLAFLALAAATAHGVQAAEVILSFPDGTDAATLDVIDLAAAYQRVRRIYDRCTAPTPAIVESDKGCRRCPAFARCPAKVSLALAFSGGLAPADLPTLELTVPAVAKGWESLKRAKQVLGQVEAAYRGFAALEPVPLGNGKTLGEVEKSREEIDGRVAYDALVATLGVEVAEAACEMSTSKAAITRAIKPAAKKGEAAGMLRTALEAIQASDGIKTKRSRSVEEH